MEDWESDLRSRLLPESAETREDSSSAAVALILRKWKGELQILLIERIRREGDPWSGQIALPGGMRDPEDTSLSETARREAMEEVSIDLDTACLSLGRLHQIRPANAPQLLVFPFVYSLRKEAVVEEGEEVRDAFWASLSRLRQSKTTKKVEARGHELVVPAFLHGEGVIWGLTYRIITALFETGLEPEGESE
ncbi:MAG: CoA pyrophosphatase [Thermoplasmata archaeon]